MTVLSVQILNPKALRLLEDMADLQLIALQPHTPLARQRPMTDEAKIAAQTAISKGSPNMDLYRVLDHISKSRKDRSLPFQDE
ncbi:hypothetical protein [Fibrella forsythiae]|uniref:Antitoxin n=1 Tax=Fibrella forsythiae TaxID=2817061 RepID=A0ABS3JP30_9BACT|nr:hypothetical protein [Fibrella forsythiae]MBO0951758.1 hypothetical protein [Fibrella forsythiae]